MKLREAVIALNKAGCGAEIGKDKTGKEYLYTYVRNRLRMLTITNSQVPDYEVKNAIDAHKRG